MTQKEKIKAAVQAAYEAACKSLEESGLKFDSQSCDDCIFVNDTEERKTYVLNIWERPCEEYEGD